MEKNRKTEKDPAVSVIMPAYNMERFVEQAVRSVMTQTFTDWELIVIDDCSTDATYSIIERLAAEDGRIRLFRNEENRGAAVTRNRCFSLVRGSHVALLDSDDVWYPEKLSRQMRLAQETGADIIYCSYGIVDENGNKICDDFIVPEETDFEASLTRAVISCSTALLSRSVVDAYRFGPEYYHEDLAFWLQILRDGHTARGVSEVLAEYRVMEGTRASNKVKSAMFRWQVYRQMLGFSVLKSARLLFRYAVLGFQKYKRRGAKNKG